MRQFYLQRAFYQLAKHPPVQLTADAKHRCQMLSAWQALHRRPAWGLFMTLHREELGRID